MLFVFIGCPDGSDPGGAPSGGPTTTDDTTPPVIALTGEATITLELGGADFVDEGATATDNDPDYGEKMATATITNSDGTEVLADALTDAVGTYTITYRAPLDAADNEAVAIIRTVQVVVVIDRDNDRLIDINTLDDLNAIRHNLDGTFYRASAGGPELLCGTDAAAACIGYELLRDLDFANPAHYDSGMVNPDWRPTDSSGIATSPDFATNPGWDPIGAFDEFSRFSGHFNGNGNTISNLYVRRGGAVGLFGASSGAIERIGVVGGNIYGGATGDHVGGLVGYHLGTITASYATGDVYGRDGNDNVGGLIGDNLGTVIASYATGSVDGGGGSGNVGGLVGSSTNLRTITASYATGSVDGGGSFVGGLVGQLTSGAVITASYATGNIDGGRFVGSLAGLSGDTTDASYGFGMVTGGNKSQGISRSTDASLLATVPNACALTQANSSTMTGMPDNRWEAAQWDFGTAVQRPIVLHNGVAVRGQTDRGC